MSFKWNQDRLTVRYVKYLATICVENWYLFCVPSVVEVKTCTAEQRKRDVSEMHHRTQRYRCNIM